MPTTYQELERQKNALQLKVSELTARVAELEAEIADLGNPKAGVGYWVDECNKARAEIERLIAENARLQDSINRCSTEEGLCYAVELERLRAELTYAYEAGWRTAAEWAHRDDLYADIGSPAYERDKANALTNFADRAADETAAEHPLDEWLAPIREQKE